MDRETLKRVAAERRAFDIADVISAPSRAEWVCGFCNKSFVRESFFMSHFCAEKEKLDKLKSHIGQTAYQFYAEWMKQCGRSVPPIETFANSKLFSAFYNFAEHSKKVHIHNPPMFIRVMRENGYDPIFWRRDECYALYLKWQDQVKSPEQQLLDTIDFLLQKQADYECDMQEVFMQLGSKKICEFLRTRKISSWILSSEVFRSWMRQLPPEEQGNITNTMNLTASISRIMERKDLHAEFNEAFKEVGL
jgi:hypothetical protein